MMDIECKLNVYMMFRRRPGRAPNVYLINALSLGDNDFWINTVE